MEMHAVMPPSAQASVERHGVWGVGVASTSEQRAPWVLSGKQDHAARSPWQRRELSIQREQFSAWINSLVADDASRAPWGQYAGTAKTPLQSQWVRALVSDLAAAAPWGGPQVFIELESVARFPGRAARPRGDGTMGAVLPHRLARRRSLHPPIRRHPRCADRRPCSECLRASQRNLAAPCRRRPGPADVQPHHEHRPRVVGVELQRLAARRTLSAVEPVDGQPVELEASINGITFRLLVERISRDRTFGKASIAISGRGKAALLDAPYAPNMNFGNESGDRTLQQLMGDVLTFNGESLGWDVAFGLTDWLVPAGVFSHNGTYMDAMNRLAEAGGGYVQAHRSLDELQVLPIYPFAPWEWTTLVDPDFELPSAPVTRESIEWVDKPQYNRVFVQGMAGGIVGRVTRAGTAGDLVAQTIVDALTTHADAARQRALPVLSDVGRIANIGLRLPVLDATGIIVPGKFVRYVDGGTTRVGLVRSVNVEVAMPQVWQTINWRLTLNLFKQFTALLPKTPLLVGVVVDAGDGMALVEELGGGRTRVRGDAAVGDSVFFRNGLIEGPAPDLTVEIIEV
jgi:hypothetical protein